MQRARKKKGKGKRAKKVKKRCLNERETLSYEQEILENNRQLARLRSRNEELEEQAEIAKEKLRQLEEDRADVIAYLKRNLEEKGLETKEHNERLSILEELRKEELEAYKKKEDAMEMEYRLMESNLSAEVKLTAGKLNALEDWRLARLDLMQKYEKQELEMAEQDKRHRETLYEAEKNAVIGKALMQKEMTERLHVLSEELRKSTTLQMAEIMHRVVQENVALNRELDNMLEINNELESVNIECKKAEETLRLKSQLFETESKMTLKTVLKQRDIIHKMANDFEELLLYYAQAEKYNKRYSELQKILDSIVERTKEKEDKQIPALKKEILIALNDKQKLLEEVQEKEKQLKALKGIINRVKSLFDEASQITQDAINKEQLIDCIGEKLLHSLNEILQTENLIDIIEYSPSEVENIDCQYKTGCLGLIEPLDPCSCDKKDKEESIEETVSQMSLEDLEQRVPSCVLSIISSSIASPKEET
nr:PREDICTED: cingulin [Megachile rotundata]XP_012150455.1 PREDICTED: cingulin [Megachile rotundata]